MLSFEIPYIAMSMISLLLEAGRLSSSDVYLAELLTTHGYSWAVSLFGTMILVIGGFFGAFVRKNLSSKEEKVNFEKRVAELSCDLEQAQNEIVELRAQNIERVQLQNSLLVDLIRNEIKIPLKSVKGTATLISHESLINPSIAEHAQDIEETGDKTISVLDNMIEYLSAEAGLMELKYVDVNLRSLLEEMTAEMQESICKKKIELVQVVDPGLPPVVKADPARWLQVARTLLSRSIYSMWDGRISQVLSVDALERYAVHLRYQLTCHGLELKGQSQDEYKQTEKSKDSILGATSLQGKLTAALCEQLCALMGGEWGIEHRSDTGTILWFTARVAYSSSTSERGPDIVSQINTTPGSQTAEDLNEIGSGASILLVEDNPINQKIAIKMLSDMECPVEVASNGNECLARLQQHTYVIVLIDEDLLDGQSFSLENMRASCSASPSNEDTAIVAMTERTDTPLRDAVDAVISKPLKKEELREIITTYIEV